MRIFAIGDDAPVLDLADQGLHHRVVDAHDGEPVERHVLDEIAECLLHGLEGLEVIEMLGIDIGDDGDIGRQFQEGAVALVGFHHHPFTGAKPRVGAVSINDAAIDHRRIEISCVEQGCDHRGGRSLAVSARDRNAAFQPHQLGQHFGAAHDRNALGARGQQFGIVALDRGRHHHHIGPGEVLGLMTDADPDALVAETIDVGALEGVGALHGVAEIAQHLGDAAHPDTPDPDEVDGSDLAR